jgi:hypothetical protein
MNKFQSVKKLLYEVLKNYPETRNDDTLLYIKCCEVLGAKTIDDMKHISLSVVTVHKIRQIIQNKEGLYKPDPDVQEKRKQREQEMRQFIRKLA